jgi:pyruvate/2-oxoglutarate/acetoin dehydrogenase E1 component/TPP-dependent pyruvate/acetoin dehydrogenase alpha subunit
LRGYYHLSVGQEAAAVGTCAALLPDDYIASTHRGHHHLIAKGGQPNRMLAELFGRVDGYNRGKGGSMHLAAPRLGILGMNGIVGGGAPIAAGAAWAAKLRKSGQVAICFFGDGGANQGVFLESLNLATVLALPVVYVCENNLFGAGTRFETVSAHPDVATRADGFSAPSCVVDGQDVEAVYDAVLPAVERARAGEGPTLVECKTYRYHVHAGPARDESRPEQEASEWLARDPLVICRRRLIEQGVATEDELSRIDVEVTEEIRAAEEFARDSPLPEPSAALTDAYVVTKSTAVVARPIEESTRELSYGDAMQEALREEMLADPTVVLWGLDMTRKYESLVSMFPQGRIFDMPISEPAYTGMGVGAAMTGLRPVVEIMFCDFTTVAMDQIVNQAAKIRYMLGGQVHVPLVIITNIGGFQSAAAQHSQMLEAWFSHIPGLKVVLPSTPYDAKGLLKAAIRDDNPVLFFFHKQLGRETGPVPDQEYVIPIGSADIKRTGDDVTLVSYSYMARESEKAADALEQEGISVEIVDLRTTLPIDMDTVLTSVRKTGRVVVAQEAVGPCSVSSEVVARISEQAWGHLSAAPVRVHAQFVPIPFAPSLEEEVLPAADDVVAAVRRVMQR